jgi:hypothetical protein
MRQSPTNRNRTRRRNRRELRGRKSRITHAARRIAALILLQPALDANYEAVKAASFDWKD